MSSFKFTVNLLHLENNAFETDLEFAVSLWFPTLAMFGLYHDGIFSSVVVTAVLDNF